MSDVSVIIPCYNGRKYIAATIESVLAQSEPVKEVIVVDDGSTDDSAAIVRQYVEGGAKAVAATPVVLIQQANAGESRARNVAIERASGEFVAFLDADDLWLPEKIARQMAMFRRLSQNGGEIPGGVHTRVFNFKDELDDCGRAETETTKDDPSIEDLITYHYIAPSSVVVRRDVLVKHQIRFDESTRHSEDMLFLADVRLVGRFRLVDEPLTAKRVHGGQQTKNPWHTIYSLENRIKWCHPRNSPRNSPRKPPRNGFQTVESDTNVRQRLDRELAAKLERQLGMELVKHLEDRYWRREVKDLAAMREYAMKVCPELMGASFLARTRIYPGWVYRLRDVLGGRK